MEKEIEKITLEFTPLELDYLISKMYCDENTIREAFRHTGCDVNLIFDKLAEKLALEKTKQSINSSEETQIAFTPENVIGFLEEFLSFSKVNRLTICMLKKYLGYALEVVEDINLVKRMLSIIFSYFLNNVN